MGRETFTPARVTVNFTAEEVAQVEAFGSAHESTAAAVWLGCWQAVMWRMSGQEQLMIGYVSSGRKYEEMATALGLFSKWVPVSAKLDERHSPGEVMRQAGREISVAEAAQDYFIWGAESGNSSTSESESSSREFFAIGYEYEEREVEYTAGPVVFRVSDQEVEAERYEVKLHCVKEGTQVRAELRYDSGVYEATAMERVLVCYQNVVRSVCGGSAEVLREVEWVSEAERKQLVDEWNRTAVAYEMGVSVMEMFERVVERAPEAVAVVSGEQELSYRELNQRANQLAHHLVSLGVGPEVRVGILLERSVEMVVAVLGVLKAGGAYVPLDLQAPLERLAFMLDDAQVPLLLCTQARRDTLEAYQGQTICLDSEWEEIAQQGTENPASRVVPENLAYVIYTSGSTGRPKGTLISHGGLHNYLNWALQRYPLAEGSGAPVHSPLSFDLTVTSLFTPLLSGKRVWLVAEAAGVDGLVQALQSGERFSLVKLTPAHLEVLAQQLSGDAELGQSSCALVIGGEALLNEQIRLWVEQASEVRLYNEYGPTETVVGCCVYEVGTSSSGLRVPIGRAIGNTRLYILDERQELVPAGVVGELYISGAGVARGYHERAELTAERFVPDPYSGVSGARMYRSGDLAQHLGTGEIEYVGRVDEQVKVRGYRVELGEIEAVLGEQAGVREAVVVQREDEGGGKRLVGYVVSEGEFKSSELREQLLQRLPEYMVPAVFVRLAEMPLTRNGKVDRKALPAPENTRADLKEPFVRARTLNEELLTEIWSEVLDVDQVGVNDNFFNLGGDSMRSIRVRAKAKKRGLNITHEQLFQYPTIRKLVQVAGTAENPVALSQVEPFQLISPADRLKLPEEIEDAYPLAQLQAGMIFHSELSPESDIFHDVHSFHLQVHLDPEVLAKAVERVVQRHPLLRTSFDLSNFSQPLQLVHRTADVPLELDDIRDLSASEQEDFLRDWYKSDKRQHFVWTRTPLLRFQVHLRTDESFQFTLSFHHAILDGWSAAALLTELFQIYLNLLEDETAPSESLLAVSFRDFVALEQAALSSPDSQRYWEQQLDGIVPTLLPRRSANQGAQATERVQNFPVPISPELSVELKNVARSMNVPIKSVLLAAHLKVMSLVSGTTDVVTGITANGRPEETDGDRVLGLFLNTLPFRVHLKPGTWNDLIQQAFEAERDSLPFRRYPLAELQRSFGGQPLFETIFNFMHYHVYDSLRDVKNVQLLEYNGYEETNFAMTAHFSLALSTLQVRLNLNYHPAVLSLDQMEALGAYYLRALEAMVTKPQQAYQSLSLLSAKEQDELLVVWNNTDEDYSNTPLTVQMFEQQVERAPEAVAVVYGQQQLSYRELNQRANQLAHHLVSLGVGPEVRVGILLERSVEMVVAVLGVLKAGGAYVPLDLQAPLERLAFMLDDAQVPLLLCTQARRDTLPTYWGQTICLDSEWDEIAQQGTENPASRVVPENLAYVIYTSGSTGRPKGTLISHGGLHNYLNWALQRYPLAEGSGAPVHSPLSFDLTVTSLFTPLLSGKRVWLVAEAAGVDGLVQALQSGERFSLVKLTPAHLEVLAQQLSGDAELGQSSCALVIGGEALLNEQIRFWVEQASEVRLYNEYGPTETVVGCCVYEVGTSSSGLRVPIGRAIGNTRLYILDERQELVPAGVVGELYISGAGVARGYHERAELTAERFVPDPYSGVSGARMYRSGDLAQHLGTGEIEYVGRVDEQVKVRGYRVELGEIEAVLGEQAGVREAVVVQREDEGGGKRLVGYVVSEGEFKSSELREQLQQRLPEYMVPAVFVRLAEMPLTRNGKVDRKAFPAPDDGRPEIEEQYVAPRNETETVLAAIWSEVLGVDLVGIHDNFFVLGGHSLLATQVISRVRDTFRVELLLRNLFDATTISQLALLIEEQQAKPAAKEINSLPITSESSLDVDALLAELEQLSEGEAQSMLQLN